MRAFVSLLALLAILAGTASAATNPSRTALLLTVKDLPPGFHVVRRAQLVKAGTEAQEFGVRTARYGRVAGAGASFKRRVTAFNDRALNQVDIDVIFFRSGTGARAAYRALVSKGRRLFVVHVGDESVGSGLSGPDVNVRWVWWRHGNMVANMSGSYFGGHPDVRSLVALARAQEQRLARSGR